MAILSASNIALSALQVADQVAAMSTNNIANANTPGFHRLIENNTELGFNSGVKTNISQKKDQYLESSLNAAQNSFSESLALKEGLKQLDDTLSNTDVTTAYDNFLSSNQQLLLNPNDPVRQKDFDIKGNAFTDSLKNLAQAFNQIQKQIQQKLDLNSIELQSVKAELSRLAAKPMDDATSNQISALETRLQSLTGSISGYNKLLSSIIPPIVGQYFDARDTITQDINNKYGKQLIDASGNWNYTPGGNNVDLASFDNGSFIEKMGTLLTSVGAQNSNNDLTNNSQGNILDSLKIQAQQSYGVNFVDETIKIQEYQKV
ncbi:MAG: hypothetical protein EBU90_26575, partial [Proteobacteria bacterium]|nr:hypothetical protein [Pseudomonadota bacterium]